MNTDEKNCLFCGEIIKAVAIKCRHCQSDLNTPETKETVETKSKIEELRKIREETGLGLKEAYEKWHYEYEGRRIGPVSADLIIEYIKDKALDGDSLIWCDDFDDWQTVKSTDFKKYLDQNIPPPLSYELVNNNFAWLIAFVPILGIITDLYIIRNFSNESVDFLYDKFNLYIFFLIYTILSWIDSVKLQNAGYDSKKFRGFIWLIPIYLYQREVAVKSKYKIIFFTWVLTYGMSFLLPLFGENIYAIGNKSEDSLNIKSNSTEIAINKIVNSKESKNNRLENTYFEIDKEFFAKIKDSNRAMVVQIALMTHYDNSVFDNVKKHEFAIRSGILDVMRQTTLADASRPDFRSELAAKIKVVMNDMLMKYEDLGGIEDVFFTSFVMQ